MKKVIAALLCILFVLSIIPAEAAEVSPIIGDVNFDGEISIVDATLIQRHLAGLETNAPVGEPYEPEMEIYPYEPIEFNAIYILENEEVSYDQEYIIIDASDLTEEMLRNRTEDLLIIERVISRATDQRTSIIINDDEDRRPLKFIPEEGIVEGTIVLSYLIYNPNNQKPDSIANRYDFILDRRYENQE